MGIVVVVVRFVFSVLRMSMVMGVCYRFCLCSVDVLVEMVME